MNITDEENIKFEYMWAKQKFEDHECDLKEFYGLEYIDYIEYLQS